MQLCLGARNGEKTPTNALVYLELPDPFGLLQELRLVVQGLLGFLLGQLGTVNNLPFKIRALGKESLS